MESTGSGIHEADAADAAIVHFLQLGVGDGGEDDGDASCIRSELGNGVDRHAVIGQVVSSLGKLPDFKFLHFIPQTEPIALQVVLAGIVTQDGGVSTECSDLVRQPDVPVPLCVDSRKALHKDHRGHKGARRKPQTESLPG